MLLFSDSRCLWTHNVYPRVCHLFMKVFWAFLSCLLKLRRPVLCDGAEQKSLWIAQSLASRAFLKLPDACNVLMPSRAMSPSLRCFGPPLRLGDFRTRQFYGKKQWLERSAFCDPRATIGVSESRRVSIGGWSRSSGSLASKRAPVCMLFDWQKRWSCWGLIPGARFGSKGVLKGLEQIYIGKKIPLFVAFRRVSE